MKPFSPVGLIGLAPMAGAGDSGFRRICRECGADYTVSEMISAKAIQFGSAKTALLAKYTKDEMPLLIQLFGRDPEAMEYASKYITDHFSPAGIDINMGCPAPKIFNNGDGSALLKDPALASKLILAVKNGTSLPVSVKMRIGIDSPCDSAIEFAKMVEDSGADFLTVHGRTREQFYSGRVDYGFIQRIKASLNIPVIANGDITDGPSAKLALDSTSADGISLARGALGNPNVFSSIKAYLDNGTISGVPLEQRFDFCIKQLEYTIEDKGEEHACVEFRKHLLWYLKGVSGAGAYKLVASRITNKEECIQLLEKILKEKSAFE